MKKNRKTIGKNLADMLRQMGHKVSSPIRKHLGRTLRDVTRGKYDRGTGR